MTLNEYLDSLGQPQSLVKNLILKTLWDAGEAFPKEWVRSSDLLSKTGQKYFDRRVRELRDQIGCDIVTEHHGGEHCYRLMSANLNNCNPRLYLSQSQKNALFSAANHTCCICGRQVAPGVRGLQADHKIPLSRSGGHDLSNWQAVCNECNVGKRRACEGCKLECSSCPWAFPEIVGSTVLVRLPQDLIALLANRGITDQKAIENFVIEALRQYQHPANATKI
jgi:5-methylcytosine-specific restriction endonuclease McrA